jgi:formylglycine-generating enzyme required for sulfatase activity
VDLVPAGDVFIGRFPVTNALFARFRPDHPHVRDGLLAEHPVVNVTREDAEAYAQHVGGRLPTGTEWEAAAGGSTWPWGDSFDHERCNCVEAGWGFTVPVDAYPAGAGPTGAEQLAGNVWEWVSDVGPDGWGVVRGGSYLDTEHGLDTRRALSADPRRATTNTGFRIVIDERREAWTVRS